MGRAGTIVKSSGQAPRALLSFLARRDHRVMNRLNCWRPPRWFRLWMVYATRAGDGWLWVALGLLLIAARGMHGLHAAGAAGVAAAVGAGCFVALKRFFRRPRPSAYMEHCWAELLPPDQFSFPSGHTITAFAVAVSFGLFFPALWPALLFCAFSVAMSRVVLGMHFLSDVVVGSLIGSGLGYAAFVLF